MGFDVRQWANHLLLAAATLVVTLASAYASSRAGYQVGWHADSGKGPPPWMRLRLPLWRQPGYFLSSDDGDALVVTQAGDLYKHNCLLGNGWERAKEDERSDWNNHGSCSTGDWFGDLEIPLAPGVVVDRLDCGFASNPVTLACRYVILENGELWVWEKVGTLSGKAAIDPTVLRALRADTCAIGGGLLGGLLGLLVFNISVRAIKRKRSNAHDPSDRPERAHSE